MAEKVQIKEVSPKPEPKMFFGRVLNDTFLQENTEDWDALENYIFSAFGESSSAPATRLRDFLFNSFPHSRMLQIEDEISHMAMNFPDDMAVEMRTVSEQGRRLREFIVELTINRIVELLTLAKVEGAEQSKSDMYKYLAPYTTSSSATLATIANWIKQISHEGITPEGKPFTLDEGAVASNMKAMLMFISSSLETAEAQKRYRAELAAHDRSMSSEGGSDGAAIETTALDNLKAQIANRLADMIIEANGIDRESLQSYFRNIEEGTETKVDDEQKETIIMLAQQEVARRYAKRQTQFVGLKEKARRLGLVPRTGPLNPANAPRAGVGMLDKARKLGFDVDTNLPPTGTAN